MRTKLRLAQPTPPLPFPSPEKVNWNHVYYFTMVASFDSIRAAAKYLSIQPSTLSEQIANLESALKVELFHRKHRKLELTEQGKRLFRHSKSMFEQGQRLIDIISPESLGMYPINMGLVPSAASAATFHFIASFSGQQQENKVNVERMTHDEMADGLLKSRIDFGFTVSKYNHPDLHQRSIFDGRLEFCGSAEDSERPLADVLKEKPLFLCRPTQSQTSMVEMLLDQFGIFPKVVVTSEFASVAVHAANHGIGVAFAPSDLLTARPNLVRLKAPQGFPELSETIFVSWAKGSESLASVEALQRFLPIFKRPVEI